jgi:hypothetical protein
MGGTKSRFYESKKGNLWGRILISMNFRVVEYWSIGVMAEVLISSFSILQ